jgi:DNA-binding GntR family transcriptional regulator
VQELVDHADATEPVVPPSTPPSEAPPPLWGSVYKRIKADIITLKLAPGQPLRESQLAVQQGVSRTPVREALRHLAYEGLVHIVANSGAVVAEISLRDFLEITRVRELLEPFVAGAAVGHLEAVTLANLETEFRRLQGTPPGPDAYRTLNEADSMLHSALLEAAGNRRIQMIMDNLYTMIHRYRYLSAASVYEASIAEHLTIIEAVKSGDSAGAEEAMRRHIVHLKENIHRLL